MTEPTRATTVVLCPGLLCDAGMWMSQMAALSARAKCFVPDYGLRTSIYAMARAVLKEAPAGPFSLAGHSMGGRVALEVHRLAPHRVERLAPLNTGTHARAKGAAGKAERTRRLAQLASAQRDGMHAMGRAWVPGIVHPDRADSPLFEALLQMLGRSTPEKFAAHIEAQLNRRDTFAQLASVQCPTLVLCGQQDTWSPLAQHQQIAQAIAGAHLEVVPHCGHMSPMERPDAVTRALGAWLDRPALQAVNADGPSRSV
jgi:pimeloyl-ACP methyl ester carboxylesterase